MPSNDARDSNNIFQLTTSLILITAITTAGILALYRYVAFQKQSKLELLLARATANISTLDELQKIIADYKAINKNLSSEKIRELIEQYKNDIRDRYDPKLSTSDEL